MTYQNTQQSQLTEYTIKTDFTLSGNEKQEVISTAKQKYHHTDEDLGRSPHDRIVDILSGEIGEKVFELFSMRNGIDVQNSQTYKYDYISNNDVKIEIKSRQTSEYPKPDLLVREKYSLSSGVYIQLDIHTVDNTKLNLDLSNLGKIIVVGYVTTESVDDADYFMPTHEQRQNPTKIVKRGDLSSPHDLLYIL